MPVKLFNDGDILTHTDVNNYFMDQALCVFNDAAERNDAFAGPGEPPNKEGRICYLKSDRTIYIYTKTSTDPAPETFAWVAQLATIADGAVTSAKILDGTIVNGDINASAAIALSKLATGALPTAITVASANIVADTIVNADISPTAEISLSKLATGALPTGITVASANLVDLTIDTADIKDAAVTSAKLGTDLSLSGTTKIEEIFEKASILNTALSSTLTIAITSGAVYYYTASTTTNITLDITTTGLADQSAVTVLVALTSGSTDGKISLIKVNNATPFAIKWFGGNHYPAGSGSGAVDAYTVTVFRNGSQYTVFASQSKFA